jgi:hypothetical protein
VIQSGNVYSVGLCKVAENEGCPALSTKTSLSPGRLGLTVELRLTVREPECFLCKERTEEIGIATTLLAHPAMAIANIDRGFSRFVSHSSTKTTASDWHRFFRHLPFLLIEQIKEITGQRAKYITAETWVDYASF